MIDYELIKIAKNLYFSIIKYVAFFLGTAIIFSAFEHYFIMPFSHISASGISTFVVFVLWVSGSIWLGRNSAKRGPKYLLIICSLLSFVWFPCFVQEKREESGQDWANFKKRDPIKYMRVMQRINNAQQNQ